MGRIPVALKAEAKDEIVEKKKSMLSEIKLFSRETVSKTIWTKGKWIIQMAVKIKILIIPALSVIVIRR